MHFSKSFVAQHFLLCSQVTALWINLSSSIFQPFCLDPYAVSLTQFLLPPPSFSQHQGQTTDGTKRSVIRSSKKDLSPPMFACAHARAHSHKHIQHSIEYNGEETVLCLFSHIHIPFLIKFCSPYCPTEGIWQALRSYFPFSGQSDSSLVEQMWWRKWQCYVSLCVQLNHLSLLPWSWSKFSIFPVAVFFLAFFSPPLIIWRVNLLWYTTPNEIFIEQQVEFFSISSSIVKN